ncbi:MAG: efflux RND transporter periplasmic adaptor subunit [Candidatus Kapaibacterium sp.]
MKRKIIIAAIGIAIIALGYLLMRWFASMAEKPPALVEERAAKYVSVRIVEYESYPSVVTAYGRLSARNTIEVFSEVSGILLESGTQFEEGVSFGKGQPMIRIDAEEARLNLYSTKSDFLTVLTSIMPDIKSDFPKSFPHWNEYLQNFEIKEPIADLPEPRSPQEKYFLASRAVFKSFYAIKNLELRLDKYIIRAPFAGSVTMSMIEPGMLIRPGQKLGEFSGSDRYELRLPAPAAEARFVGVGDPVVATVGDMPAKWNGRVGRVNRKIDPTTQTLNIFAEISGENLREGMYMRAEIKGIRLDSVLRVPRRALVNNNYIYIARDSALYEESIELVRMDESSAFIRGVRPGDTVITEPIVGASPGMAVIPVFE